MKRNELPPEILKKVMEGTVIPAIPCALDASRRFDEKRQKALIRYYIDSGVGGIAVAVGFPSVGLVSTLPLAPRVV